MTGPRPVPPALVDIKVLVVAALVASPAAYRAAQGLLPVDEALTRFLLVAVGCVAVSSVVRALWPVIAGETVDPVRAAADAARAALPTSADGDLGLSGAGFDQTTFDQTGFDQTTFDEHDVDGFAGFSAFDDLDAVEPSA